MDDANDRKWDRVEITTRAVRLYAWNRPVSPEDPEKTRQTVFDVMKAHFPDGPEIAARAHAAYVRHFKALVKSFKRNDRDPPERDPMAKRWDGFWKAYLLIEDAKTREGTVPAWFDPMDDVRFPGLRWRLPRVPARFATREKDRHGNERER